MGGAGKGPGIGWSRAQPKYSWEANLYATRWFCADRSRTEQQWKIIISRTVCQYFRVCAIQKLKIHLIAYYSNATRTGSTLSRTKYVKCFRVETSCYRVVLRLKFIVTVELLYDQAESDFVQCQTKMRAFASRICSEFKQIELNWNRIVHQNALWSLVFSTTRPWNKQISAPDASQPSSQERWQVADLKHFKISYIFSLPRISTKDFPYIKGKIDRSIGINYSSVNFKWTQVFLCYQSFDTLGARNFSCAVSGFGQVSQRSMNF